MTSFLESIADRLLEKFPDSMEGIAIVLPSKRSIVFLKSYIAERIDKPIFLPRFFSVEEFIESLSGLKVIDNLSLQFYLYQSYLDSPPSKVDSFDEFLNWGSILLHDFNEVDRNLVDVESIFTNLKEVKDLENWNIEDWSFSADNLTDSQDKYIGFYNDIYNWYLDINRRLRKDNVAYQGMAYRQAAENISVKQISWDQIWFVGLNALTESEKKIVNYLKEEDIARIFWDADEYYYNNPNHEAGSFLRDQRNKWHEIDFQGVGRYFHQKKDSFDIIACPKNISQARAVSEILGRLPEEDVVDSRTAIVLADEALLYPVLNYLPSNIKDINVTMGSPLRHTPFYSFLETLLRMQLHAKGHKENLFYYKDVLKVINHPIFSKMVSSQKISMIREQIIFKNEVFISTDFMQDSLGSSFEKVASIFHFLNTSGDFIANVGNLIHLLREGISVDQQSIEIEVLFKFNNIFSLIQRLISENKFDVDIKSMQSILRHIISKEVVQFEGEPLKGVQLMGILESRTLDFRNVILLNVNEGFLPKGKTFNSFIPYDMKRYFNMPTYSDNDAVYSYHFYRLLQRAKNISILYNTETDDFGSGERSRFLPQLIAEYHHNPIKQFVFGGDVLDFKQETDICIPNNGLSSEISRWSKWVSPSALNMYINCSLSFYYKYLARIRQQDNVEEFAESNIIGSSIHEALDDVYPLGPLTSSKIQEVAERLISSVEVKFGEYMKGSDIYQGKNYLALQVAKKLASNFLDFEKEALDISIKDGITTNILESEGVFQHDLDIGGHIFTIKGKVDRVDEFGDKIRVIDYKSGRVDKIDLSFREWNDLIKNQSKSKAFQLLIYTYLYLKSNPHYLDRRVIAGNFSFKNLEEGLITVSHYVNNKKETLCINKDILEEIELLIGNIVKKIMSEDFVQTDDKKRCEYCDYKSICNR